MVRSELARDITGWLVDEITEDRPDVVGFSVAFGDQLPQAIELARWVKELLPGSRILLGGSQVNLLQEVQQRALADSRIFDSVMLGNGETAILYAVNMDRTHGVKSGLLRSPQLKEAHLADLPMPRFLDVDLYFPPLTIPVPATKGCFWGKCAFCDYVRLSVLGVNGPIWPGPWSASWKRSGRSTRSMPRIRSC